MHSRRLFAQGLAAGATGLMIDNALAQDLAAIVAEEDAEQGLFELIKSQHGQFDKTHYCQLLGAANPFKEGDEIIGVAAVDEAARGSARTLLYNTRLQDIDDHPPHTDEVLQVGRSAIDTSASRRTQDWTLGKLKHFLLNNSEADIKSVMSGLSSDVIGCLVKLLSNAELVAAGAKIFNPLPGTNIGARGYLGARVQPNSPTDHPDDIRWQVFDAFAYAVGDVLLGTNPVSSLTNSVVSIQRTLQEILQTFAITQCMPHCVLSHIDVQSDAERVAPGSTELWFQSIAGTDSANETFDLTVGKLERYARLRTGPYGLYFETGQGADFTNGHGHGFDMVLHESRKYGLARALKQHVATACGRDAWVHVNDVAGFIGPEVFRTRDQLVRCCLEDIVMGKLHGLCIGLDVCSTLHMDVSLSDLDWCLEQIAPACPAYLMALPTKIDPMLGYLTTGYHDHVRLREKFGLKVNDSMWDFFKRLGVIGAEGKPTEHFGDPIWVYLQYCRRRGDRRAEDEIRAEGQQQVEEVRSRGLFIAEGFGESPVQMRPDLASQVQSIYDDGKLSIWAELTAAFAATIPNRLDISSASVDRQDYILHPESGERLSPASMAKLALLQFGFESEFDTQIVISDGLNADSIMDDGQLLPTLHMLREKMQRAGYKVANENLLVTSGRVRTGYRIGETIFNGSAGRRTLLHIIGERPGSGHHTFSIYITSADASIWSETNAVDHNITKVVSGIATTALVPRIAVDNVIEILTDVA